MTDKELRANLCELETYEGRVPHMYLDSADHPNVTVGIGCLLTSVDVACALPFQCNGRSATREEILEDWMRVSAMPGRLRASAYRGNLTLRDQDIDALAFSRMRAMLRDLPAVFPGFDGFPCGVRQALLDLGWNMGLGAAPGLRGWAKLREACNKVPPDWARAAQECTTKNPLNSKSREVRNAWRAQMFVDAARGEGR